MYSRVSVVAGVVAACAALLVARSLHSADEASAQRENQRCAEVFAPVTGTKPVSKPERAEESRLALAEPRLVYPPQGSRPAAPSLEDAF